MAEVTKQISYLGVADASLTATWDDVTLALTRFNLTTAATVEVKLWRTGQTPWREFTLPPGSYQYDAGGPVQNWSDITLIRLATV